MAVDGARQLARRWPERGWRGPPPRQHLEEEHSDPKEITLGARGASVALLGAHIRARPEHTCRCSRRGISQMGDPEVTQAGRPRVVEENVCRLDISMEDS